MRIILVLFFSLSVLCFAQTPNLDSALKSYQSSDYETAKKLLDEDLAKDPNNTLTLYNLGLAEYKVGNPGKALGYWRKALQINPSFGQAEQAVFYAQSQLRLARPEDVPTFEVLLAWVEKNVPTLALYMAALLFLFLGCLHLLRFFSDRRKSLYNDTATPAFPMNVLLYLVLFLLLMTPVFHSYRFYQFEKATVITKDSEIKTGPNAENATLFSLTSGEEVILLDKIEDWYKIKDNTGRIGWLSKESLFLTSER